MEMVLIESLSRRVGRAGRGPMLSRAPVVLLAALLLAPIVAADPVTEAVNSFWTYDASCPVGLVPTPWQPDRPTLDDALGCYDPVPVPPWMCRDTGAACCETVSSDCLMEVSHWLAQRIGNEMGVPFCFTLDLQDGVPARADLGKACGGAVSGA